MTLLIFTAGGLERFPIWFEPSQYCNRKRAWSTVDNGLGLCRRQRITWTEMLLKR
jgi:hypothetical protein